MASEEPTAVVPLQYVELCSSLVIRCRKCDDMTDDQRLYFLDKIKTQRQCVYSLAKGLCEYHPRSGVAFSVWDMIINCNAADKGKERLTAAMFVLGNSSTDRTAFNLFLGCTSQWDFLRECTLPDSIPEFAVQSTLSRSLTGQSGLSWEKVMVKLDEALGVDELTEDAALRAMLTCRVLIQIETKEFNGHGVLRLGEDGRQLMNTVLPCSVSGAKTWPASSLIFYVIFKWMEGARMTQRAVEEFTRIHKAAAEKAGYCLTQVTLDKPDTLSLRLRHRRCGHSVEAKATLEHSSGRFRVTPECRRCPAANGRGEPLLLKATHDLARVFLVAKMFEAYVSHNNPTDLPRELIVASVLYILRAGYPTRMREIPEKTIQDIVVNMKAVRASAPASVLPPLVACDFRTAEGQRRKRKPRKGAPVLPIPMPKKAQTVEMYMEGMRICEESHGKQPSQSLFREACGNAVEELSKRKASSFDITLDMVPKAMMEVEVSTPARSPSLDTSHSPMPTKVKSLKRTIQVLDSDSDDDDDDDDAPVEPKRSSPSSKMDTQPTLSQRAIPMSVATSARAEHVVLQGTIERSPGPTAPTVDSRPLPAQASPASNDGHASQSDDEEEDDEEDEGSDNQSDSENESDGDGDGSERDETCLPSPLNTPSDVLMSTVAPKLPAQGPSGDPIASVPIAAQESDALPLRLQSQQSVGEDGCISDLFNGINQGDCSFDQADFFRVAMGKDRAMQLDPLPSEVIARGEPVRGEGTITVGPVSPDTARRGKCLVDIMREVGGLGDIVPRIDLVTLFNGEHAFCVHTDKERLYSLDTYPGEWTTLDSSAAVARTVFMATALQALNPSDLGRFLVTADRRVVWLPPTTGRHELGLHPLGLMQSLPDVGRRFRMAVRADAGFVGWVEGMRGEARIAVERMVRNAGLTTRDESKTIDLDFFGRFFDQLANASPWIRGL